MITLFENITEQLTDLEKEKLVPLMKSLLLNTDEETRLTAASLCGFLKYSGYQVTPPRIRKMVNYLRVTNKLKPFVLIGASNGYFITGDLKIIDAQIESLTGRAESMLAAVDGIKAQKENLKH